MQDPPVFVIAERQFFIDDFLYNKKAQGLFVCAHSFSIPPCSTSLLMLQANRCNALISVVQGPFRSPLKRTFCNSNVKTCLIGGLFSYVHEFTTYANVMLTLGVCD